MNSNVESESLYLNDTDSNQVKVQKFKDLKVNQKYEVRRIDGPFPSKFKKDGNKNYYVLLISEFGSKKTITTYSTNMLAEYLDGRKSNKKFNFTVTEKNGVKYPIIEGYIKKRNWTVLE